MEKLDLTTPNFTNENIAKLAELFPHCVTEKEDGTTKDTKGHEKKRYKKVIDFDALRQEFSDTIVEGQQERYTLNWPGKRGALVTANTPISKTLRPCRDESVDFDTTKNIFIEGDNLDALKLLQETYLNKIKMIYIDPPYNTGKDFVYSDNFTVKRGEYDEASGQRDEEGGRLVANPDSNGRFHSDWLSMLYPRLKLARNLLSEEGVVFISIDDNEITNLRKICYEIFGEQNFIAQIIWKKRSTPPNDRIIAAQHEYILCLTKNNNYQGLNLRPRSDEQLSRYKNPDDHPNGPWSAGDLMANVKGGRYVASLYYPIVNPRTGQEHYPSSKGNWRFNEERVKQLILNNEIYFGENDNGRPKLKRFLCNVKDGITWTSLWDFTPFNTVGSKEMADIFGNLTTFENPKPTGLILETLRAGSGLDSIILDFFAGSGTTAHAVMKLNAKDGGNRKCISVQLPEITDEKSEAFKEGYKNIAEISKERIRRAGNKIKEDNADKEGIENLDIGFRVFKIDSSNMVDVTLSPDEAHPDMFDEQVSNIKQDRSSEDLLFQVLLDWGVDLSLPISKETITINHETHETHESGKASDKENFRDFRAFRGKKSFEVFFVDGNALAACFDKGVNEEFVKKLAEKHPLRVVFRDDGFSSDAVKINVEQIFKLKSPATDIKVI